MFLVRGNFVSYYMQFAYSQAYIFRHISASTAVSGGDDGEEELGSLPWPQFKRKLHNILEHVLVHPL
jgi:hypothetical protein